MKAIELNGTHIGKTLKVSFRLANRDGVFRANAKQHVWYVINKGNLTHYANGNILLHVGTWYKSYPIENIYNYSYVHPDYIPYYADVEVMDD